jgi:hypothetical protein
MVDFGQHIIKNFYVEITDTAHLFTLRSPSVCTYCFQEWFILNLSRITVSLSQIGEGESRED